MNFTFQLPRPVVVPDGDDAETPLRHRAWKQLSTSLVSWRRYWLGNSTLASNFPLLLVEACKWMFSSIPCPIKSASERPLAARHHLFNVDSELWLGATRSFDLLPAKGWLSIWLWYPYFRSLQVLPACAIKICHIKFKLSLSVSTGRFIY